MSTQISPLVQRQIEEEEEEALQTKQSTGHTPEVTPQVASAIASIRGGGQPLPAAERAFFEPRFGHDFSQVRIHSSAEAAESAKAVNAQAFTTGQHVVFRLGEYRPGSASGRKLLAHELTHVVQQTKGLNSFLQRQDVDNQVCKGGVGRNKVGDIFRLYATGPSNDRPGEALAMIGLLNQNVFYSKFYHLGDWLKDEWEIVEITREGNVIVINVTCGTEETLELEPGQPPVPEQSVVVQHGKIGRGIVRIFDRCNRVEYEFLDKSKSPREYKLETLRKPGISEMLVYVLQSGERTLYPPMDLERILGLHLTGEKCGELLTEEEVRPQPGWEDLIPGQ